MALLPYEVELRMLHALLHMLEATVAMYPDDLKVAHLEDAIYEVRKVASLVHKRAIKGDD